MFGADTAASAAASAAAEPVAAPLPMPELGSSAAERATAPQRNEFGPQRPTRSVRPGIAAEGELFMGGAEEEEEEEEAAADRAARLLNVARRVSISRGRMP